MHSQMLEAPEARLGLTARHEMRSSCPHITISSSDGIALGVGLRLSVKRKQSESEISCHHQQMKVFGATGSEGTDEKARYMVRRSEGERWSDNHLI